MENKLHYIKEPELTFGYGQKTADPRDGLILFGPHEKFESYQVKAGVIGYPFDQPRPFDLV